MAQILKYIADSFGIIYNYMHRHWTIHMIVIYTTCINADGLQKLTNAYDRNIKANYNTEYWMRQSTTCKCSLFVLNRTNNKTKNLKIHSMNGANAEIYCRKWSCGIIYNYIQWHWSIYMIWTTSINSDGLQSTETKECIGQNITTNYNTEHD